MVRFRLLDPNDPRDAEIIRKKRLARRERKIEADRLGNRVTCELSGRWFQLASVGVGEFGRPAFEFHVMTERSDGTEKKLTTLFLDAHDLMELLKFGLERETAHRPELH